MMKDIVIVGGARDYHVMDWYRTVKALVSERKVILLTDLIGGEGFDILVTPDDTVKKLFIIDWFLFRIQSRKGDLWRNIFKLIVLPIQVFLLKRYAKKHPDSVYHAQPMYYMFLCWLAGVEFIGTPQGSEVLVRPKRSKLYKYFATKALNAAKFITIDSQSMKDAIKELSGKDAMIIQNGIDIQNIAKYRIENKNKNIVCSIRGMTELYRIKNILEARNSSNTMYPITFIYPFQDQIYRNEIDALFQTDDKDLGRLGKEDMYKLLASAKLVISIPESDSSPRSVYESIFSGACVAVTYNPWIDILPVCMKKRVFIVDLEDNNWFDNAIKYANSISKRPYVPSEEAMEMFDEKRTMRKAIELLY